MILVVLATVVALWLIVGGLIYLLYFEPLRAGENFANIAHPTYFGGLTVSRAMLAIL